MTIPCSTCVGIAGRQECQECQGAGSREDGRTTVEGAAVRSTLDTIGTGLARGPASVRGASISLSASSTGAVVGTATWARSSTAPKGWTVKVDARVKANLRRIVDEGVTGEITGTWTW